jgi:serine/threonine protein kinase
MSSKPKKKVVITPIEIPPEFKDKVNSVRSRILFLSPSVMRGEERECRKDDFESISNSNIGVGGFGKVYKVRHKVSKNVFAIKVINKKKIIEHDLVEQIKLEVKIMYKLNHDHILKLYNHYEDDDNFYLILQYCAKG